MKKSLQVCGPIHVVDGVVHTPAFTVPLAESTWRVTDERVDLADELSRPWVFVVLGVLLIGATWGQAWAVVMGIAALVVWVKMMPMQGHLDVVVASAEHEFLVQLEGRDVTPAFLDRLTRHRADEVASGVVTRQGKNHSRGVSGVGTNGP